MSDKKKKKKKRFDLASWDSLDPETQAQIMATESRKKQKVSRVKGDNS